VSSSVPSRSKAMALTSKTRLWMVTKVRDYLDSGSRRPRERGDPATFEQRHWIPAFAGMTPMMQSFVQSYPAFASSARILAIAAA
jgi:hypothetical protein